MLLLLKDENMKRFLLFTATFIMAVAIASPASALLFDVSGGPGSSVDISVLSTWGDAEEPVATLNDDLNDITFNLAAGQSRTFDFFYLTADVSEGGWLGGGSAEISATLAFDLPAGTSGTGGGDGSWFTFLGLFSGGDLHWTHQPDEVVLATPVDGVGSFSIVFSDIAGFEFGNSATVQATVTASGVGVASVPEPGTIVLMGIGLVGLARFGRRKFKA
jgi:hypothetical protein